MRTQISDLHDKIDEATHVFKIPYDNMNTTTNYYFSTNGTLSHYKNSSLVITDYIQIPYYIKKILVNKYFSSTTYNNNDSSIVFYNKHMIPISIISYRTICENNEITVGMNKFILDVPEDSAYIRLTLENTSENIITQSYIMFYNIPDIENPSYYYDLIKNTIIHEVSDISWEENKYLNNIGNILNYDATSDSTYYISDFIPVGDYNNIFIYNHKYTRNSNPAHVCFYNKLKNSIQAIPINSININDIINIPQRAVYVRFSIFGDRQLDTIEEKIYLLNPKKIENDASLYDSELIKYTYITKYGTMSYHSNPVFNAGFIFVGDASSLILTTNIIDHSGYSFFDYDGNLIYSVTNESRISKYNYSKTVDIGVPENAATMRFTTDGAQNTYFKKYKDYKKLKKYNINYGILHDGYINESDEEVESDLYMYSNKLLLLQNEYFILNNYTKSNTDNPCYAIIYSASNTINRIISYNNNYGPLIYKAGVNDYYIRFCIDSDCDSTFEIFFTSFINNSDIEIPFYNEPDIHDSIGLIQCFDKVGCIGDSLASGEVVYLDSNGERHYSDKYQHSWGQYLARMTGNTYYNWSSGGRTTKSWLTSPYATQCYDGNHLCSAYIIGLAANDIDSSKLPGGVGEESDIDLEDYTNNNPDTFYGCYGTIIQKILEIQPLAKIFIFTLPISNEQANIFNTAIRNIASKFSNVYLVDLASPENIQFYNSTLIRKCLKFGHYNAIGYRQMALFIANQINKVMKDNIDDFMDIDWIPIS